tara:strand:- start:385 stop:2118 length:1734 start_codon:yes stop_codon:yes gene_type:complete
MNIFFQYTIKIKKLVNDLKKKGKLNLPSNLDSVIVDIPPENFVGDISCNIAMIISKINKKNPLDLANLISKEIKDKFSEVDEIFVVKPGFLNLKFKNSFWNIFLKETIKKKNHYGISNKKNKENYLIEFVSANPTGPLHVGHCRGAILGDVISNVLKFNQHNVTKEYYVNDHGNQIINFTQSVYYRIREILYNKKFPIDNEDLYPGDYIIQIAQNIINKNKNIKFNKFEDVSNKLSKLSVIESLKLIKINLKNLGIYHDNFVNESDLVKTKEVDKVIKKLQKGNFLFKGKIKAPKSKENRNWKERDQLLFKSTNFGDDKDRSLTKLDGSWTYFAGDVAYHNNKLNRKFTLLINILGADHAGYTKRITSVVEALSGEKNKLICKVSQLVKLIKDGKPFKMSKRKGDYITIEDLINEVGKDATRFIMLSRSNEVELDFDFEKVTEKSKENPLYYVQYCYARIASVFRNLNSNINKDLDYESFDFNFNIHEIEILKKISQWPRCIDITSKKLEPHRIPIYLYQLAALFHSYWNLGKNNPEFRFINENKSVNKSKIALIKVISNIIKNGMNIIGVNTPEKM